MPGPSASGGRSSTRVRVTPRPWSEERHRTESTRVPRGNTRPMPQGFAREASTNSANPAAQRNRSRAALTNLLTLVHGRCLMHPAYRP